MIQNNQDLKKEHERLMLELSISEKRLKKKMWMLKEQLAPDKLLQSITVELLSNKRVRNLLLSETALVFLSNILMKNFKYSGMQIWQWVIGKKKQQPVANH